MTIRNSLDPPLHRRYSEKAALEQVQNRYTALRQDIDHQVRMLQGSQPFLEKCKALYENGFKDWIILSAVFNVMLNLKMREEKIPYDLLQMRDNVPKIRSLLKGTTYPEEHFLGFEFDVNLEMHFSTVLETWGFEVRRRVLSPEVVRDFLRRRMKHFDHDIPHKNLFGDPPGDWPEL